MVSHFPRLMVLFVCVHLVGERTVITHLGMEFSQFLRQDATSSFYLYLDLIATDRSPILQQTATVIVAIFRKLHVLSKKRFSGSVKEVFLIFGSFHQKKTTW